MCGADRSLWAVARGGSITLDLEQPEEARYDRVEAFLGPAGEDKVHTNDSQKVDAAVVAEGTTLIVTLPAEMEPGQWRLFVRASLDIAGRCPAESCLATAPVRFSQILTVE